MNDFLERLLRGRYVGLLEGEVTRLRAENRALTNSLLGTAGFPPVEYPQAPKPQPVRRQARRSWHQIQPWREIKARGPQFVLMHDTPPDFDGGSTAGMKGPDPH